MFGLNRQQLYTIGKAVLLAGGPSLIILGRYIGLTDDVSKAILDIVGVLIGAVGGVALVADKTDRQMAVDAATVPGVQVHADPSKAPAPVVDAARDPKVTDVVPMVGGPASSEQKHAG